MLKTEAPIAEPGYSTERLGPGLRRSENSSDSPQVVTRRRSWTKGAPPEWFFKAFAPSQAPGDELFWYADESSCLTIAPEGPRPRKPVKSTPVSGLKMLDKPPQLQICAPTQMDHDADIFVTSDVESVGSQAEAKPRRAAVQAKDADQDRARSRSRLVFHLYAIAHSSKHSSEFEPWFAVDEEEGSQAWGANLASQS